MLERELREGVRAIDNHFDVAGAGHLANLLHREDLARAIRDMAEVQHARFGRDGFFKDFHQMVHAGRGHGELHLLQHDAVAAFALLPGGDRAPVVLISGDDFVTGFQLHAELDDLEETRWRCG